MHSSKVNTQLLFYFFSFDGLLLVYGGTCPAKIRHCCQLLLFFFEAYAPVYSLYIILLIFGRVWQMYLLVNSINQCFFAAAVVWKIV